jgi:hypothetical protein
MTSVRRNQTPLLHQLRFDIRKPGWNLLKGRERVASRPTCNCQTARCQFSTEGIVAVDEKFELRILCRSEARVNEVQVYYATHLPTASTLAECLHEIGNLFFQLAFFCECRGSGAPIFPRGSDAVIPADDTAYFLSLTQDQIGLRRHINQNIINRIRHPVERHCHLEYVYILSSSLDDMVKIGVSGDHPERRLSGITQCYPNAVLVAYTVRIPYAYRVEQLAHAELALWRVVHACGRCYTNHREWFKVSPKMAMRVVLHWAKWIGSQPYDNKGALDVAWMRILDGRHLSRLRPATEDEPTDNQISKEADRERIREAGSEDIGDADPGGSKEEDWGTWTTLRPSERREDFSTEVDMNICSEKVSPFVREFYRSVLERIR